MLTNLECLANLTSSFLDCGGTPTRRAPPSVTGAAARRMRMGEKKIRMRIYKREVSGGEGRR
jgi:hypothetical protein